MRRLDQFERTAKEMAKEMRELGRGGGKVPMAMVRAFPAMRNQPHAATCERESERERDREREREREGERDGDRLCR